jgi:hypothetical protein
MASGLVGVIADGMLVGVLGGSIGTLLGVGRGYIGTKLVGVLVEVVVVVVVLALATVGGSGI